MILSMSAALPRLQSQPLPVPPAAEHRDTLRMIMEWIADRFAETGEIDDSIDWEDGEEHDEPIGPATL